MAPKQYPRSALRSRAVYPAEKVSLSAGSPLVPSGQDSGCRASDNPRCRTRFQSASAGCLQQRRRGVSWRTAGRDVRAGAIIRRVRSQSSVVLIVTACCICSKSAARFHLIVANRRTDRVGLTGHFGRGHLPLPRPHFRMPRSRQYAMRFCLFCDAYDSNEAGGISSRLFIDAPLGFGDRAPWRARRGTDRCSAVPPCVWRGGDG